MTDQALHPHNSNVEDVEAQESSSETLQHQEPQSPSSNEKDKDDNNEPDLTRSSSTVSIAQQLSRPREFLFVSCIVLIQFLTQAALGQTLSILHVIGDHYSITNPGVLSWLIAGYSLTVGSFILLSGRFGDVFGYKKMVLIGYIWFAIWSMIAGLAVYSNHVLFIFARVMQGVGPSICLPNGLAILGASYAPGKKKAMMFAIFGAAAPGGSIVGALFAGLFSLAWWPWTFWSFAVTIVVVAAVGSYAIPDPPREEAQGKMSLRERAVQLDLLGGVTGITALILVNFAWNQSGVVGWQEPYVYVCLILGFLIFPGFIYVEKTAASPLIPFEALSADVAFVLVCVGCGWACFGIWVYYIWQIAEVLKGVSPLLATAYICPVAVSGACASLATGFLLGRMRPAWVMTIALTFFTIGTILIATAPVDQIYWAQFFICTIVIPWGMDMSFPAATLILSNAVSKKHQGIAASLVNTVVNYSISLSLGFAGTIEGQVNNGGVTPADKLKGYRSALYFGIGLAGLGICTSLTFLIRSYVQDRKQGTEKGIGHEEDSSE